ncbi:MAG TPA: hypothetical protein VIO81_16360 [Methyloversatilis sp.]
MRGWLTCALVALAMPADAGISLRLARVSSPALTLDDVRIDAARLDGGAARVRAARALFGSRVLNDVQLDCADFVALPSQRCRGGVLRARGFGPWPVEFGVQGKRRTLDARLQLDRDTRIEVDGELAGKSPHLSVKAGALDLSRLLADVTVLKPYVPSGRVDLALELTDIGARRSPALHLRIALSAGRFSSADALRAAEAVSATVDVEAHRIGDAWNGTVALDWQGGELLWDSVYLRGGGTVLSSSFVLLPRALEFVGATLDLAGAGRLSGDAAFVRAPFALRTASLQGEDFDLSVLNERFIAPLFAARGWPALDLKGRADFVASADGSGLRSATLRLNDAQIADVAGRFALDGVNAELPWQGDTMTALKLSVGHAQFGRIPADGFELRADLAPGRFALQPTRIPLLDAGLRLNVLRFDRIDGRWNGDLSADLEPVSMPALTHVLGWPRMAGSLGASIPRVSWRSGVLSLDGQMVIQVFDGYVVANGLQVIEPFGAMPRVLADLQMRYIDLEALTETFRFGRVTGRLDGDVAGLELLRWVPVSFDARIGSSEGDYPRTISQRAVESITALGGPGAAAAIQRSFLGFFERFGYRRMGLSCRLRAGVCEMDGLAEKGGGYMLIEGGGVPALSVVGYNRRVDWQELLDRLARVTETRPVVR